MVAVVVILVVVQESDAVSNVAVHESDASGMEATHEAKPCSSEILFRLMPKAKAKGKVMSRPITDTLDLCMPSKVIEPKPFKFPDSSKQKKAELLGSLQYIKQRLDKKNNEFDLYSMD